MLTAAQAFSQAQALHQEGRLDEAESLYRLILGTVPTHGLALQLLGMLRARQGDAEEGERLIRKAVQAHPGLASAWKALISLAQQQRQPEKLGTVVMEALSAISGNFDLCLTAGTAFYETGNLMAAIVVFQHGVCVAPDTALAFNNFGVALNAVGQMAEACEAFRRAVTLSPNDPGALSNYASSLRATGDLVGALERFKQAIALNPDMPDVHFNLGNLYAANSHREKALIHYRASVQSRHSKIFAQRELLYNLLFGCHFAESEQVFQQLQTNLPAGVAQERDWRRLADILYLHLFCRLSRSEYLTVRDRLAALLPEEPGARARVAATVPPPAEGRLRIGYLSPNFGNHPVGHVTRGLYGLHDRSRFEVHAFSLEDRSGELEPFHGQIRRQVDHFHEIGALSDQEAAAAIRAQGIHILVDLNGAMTPKRIGIVAHRGAPVQVYWLGHAGGVGIPGYDYMFGDAIVIPPGEEELYREQVVRLPECYHIYDRPAISPTCKPRSAYGLKEGVVVFCAFNNPQKIDRQGFDLWMRILRAVPDSQLWLSGNDDAMLIPNLRQEAQARGVAPDRLVFATRVQDKAEHYARHRLADLFLDTFTLTASTTALDALWAGLPIVTLHGAHFPSRIAASMLTAAGMPETITTTPEAYVALALELAADPVRRAALREKLIRNRDRCPLFDTPRFVHHLEAAYVAMWGQYAAGRPATGFNVSPLPALSGAPLPVSSLPASPLPASPVPASPLPARSPSENPVPPANPVPALPASGTSLPALQSVRRILVIKPDEIGDFILATPLLRALRQHAPQARIHLAASAVAYPLAETCPFVDQVAWIENSENGVRFAASDPAVAADFLAAFRARAFDLALVARFDFDRYNGGALALASGAPLRVGFSETVTPLKAKRNAGFDARFYTHALSRPANRHEVMQNLALLSFLTGGDPQAPPFETRLDLTTATADVTAAEAALAGLPALSKNRGWLAVCPGSSYPAKMVPVARLAGLVSRVQRQLGWGVLVLGGAKEQALGEALLARLGSGDPALKAVSLCGALNLRQAAEVIRRCRGLLGMCSAPGHLAAAVGTPVAIISCHPRNGDPGHFHAPERFRPWPHRDGDVLVIQPETPLWPCVASCEAPESHCITAFQEVETAARLSAFFMTRAAARGEVRAAARGEGGKKATGRRRG